MCKCFETIDRIFLSIRYVDLLSHKKNPFKISACYVSEISVTSADSVEICLNLSSQQLDFVRWKKISKIESHVFNAEL